MPEARHNRVLALDFDGVICNSSREVFMVGLEAYKKLRPETRLDELLSPDSTTDPAHRAGLFERFTNLIPLGNRAEDFGVALLSLEQEVDLPVQEAYDQFFAAQPRGWLASYHAQFYEQRERLRDLDLEAWLELHSPYEPFSTLLHRYARRVTLSVATAKDRRSVALLLEHFGLGELFADELILDKDSGRDKSAHLQTLSSRLHSPFDLMTFVDDKVNHLEKVAHLGVRPALAGWGFNSHREHALARARGYTVASLANAESTLFKGSQT